MSWLRERWAIFLAWLADLQGVDTIPPERDQGD